MVTLVLTGVAIVLFARSRIPLETSALVILVLIVTFFAIVPYGIEDDALEPKIFFLGFGHEALVAICALMIMGRGLERTGALYPVARSIARLWPRYPQLALLLTLVLGAVFSAFVNNTPIVVMLLPMLVAVCLRNQLPSAGILLPMGLATIVGGMATTIGTSTNLLVVTLAADLGLREFRMFDFALPAVIAGCVGVTFLWAVAPKLLPARQPPLTDTSPRVFTAKVRVDDEHGLAGKTIAEVRGLTNGRMHIEEVRRSDQTVLMRLPTAVLEPGDELVVRETPENLRALEKELGTPLVRDDESQESPADNNEQRLAEIAVTAGSLLDGRTLADVNFEMRFGLQTVALHRPGVSDAVVEIDQTRLRIGDVLLVQGDAESLGAVKRTGEMLVLDGAIELPVQKKSRLALFLMIAVVIPAALGLVSIAVAAVCGVLGMLLTRCLKWSDAADALAIPVIMIIVTSLALGTALIETGGARFLANLFLVIAADLPVPIVLSAVMLGMAVATNVISNNAAAIIGTPIAADVAASLAAPVEPFLLAVIFGANMSFATPIGYKTNLLVMSAGGYRFSDFVRVGVPLTLLMWATLSWLLWLLYDL